MRTLSADGKALVKDAGLSVVPQKLHPGELRSLLPGKYYLGVRGNCDSPKVCAEPFDAVTRSNPLMCDGNCALRACVLSP
jgi:hypothetical protein